MADAGISHLAYIFSSSVVYQLFISCCRSPCCFIWSLEAAISATQDEKESASLDCLSEKLWRELSTGLLLVFACLTREETCGWHHFQNFERILTSHQMHIQCIFVPASLRVMNCSINTCFSYSLWGLCLQFVKLIPSIKQSFGPPSVSSCSFSKFDHNLDPHYFE